MTASGINGIKPWKNDYDSIQAEINHIKKTSEIRDFRLEKKDLDLRIYFKKTEENKTTYITDILYYEKTDGKEVFLGAFSMKFGLVNRECENFITSGDICIESSFFQDYLKGISLEVLKSPCRLCGIALSTLGDLYETEPLVILDIDKENHTLFRWLPNWW